jgi:hypothetical protein
VRHGGPCPPPGPHWDLNVESPGFSPGSAMEMLSRGQDLGGAYTPAPRGRGVNALPEHFPQDGAAFRGMQVDSHYCCFQKLACLYSQKGETACLGLCPEPGHQDTLAQLNCVSPKFIYWNPNSQYLVVCLYLDTEALKRCH